MHQRTAMEGYNNLQRVLQRPADRGRRAQAKNRLPPPAVQRHRHRAQSAKGTEEPIAVLRAAPVRCERIGRMRPRRRCNHRQGAGSREQPRQLLHDELARRSDAINVRHRL